MDSLLTEQKKACKTCGVVKALNGFHKGSTRCKECYLDGDAYMVKLLTKDSTIRAADVPPKLIAMKREQLQIYRLTKQLKQVIKEKQMK